jgi:membrane protein YqaA with SNARE-associated domain
MLPAVASIGNTFGSIANWFPGRAIEHFRDHRLWGATSELVPALFMLLSGRGNRVGNEVQYRLKQFSKKAHSKHVAICNPFQHTAARSPLERCAPRIL